MHNFNDQAAMGFVIAQGRNLENEIYRIKRRAFNYAEIVPVVTEGNQWAIGTQFRVVDHTGQAKWLNGKATDVPFVKGTRQLLSHDFAMLGSGWEWSDEEVAQAQLYGINLASEDSMAADETLERKLYDIAITGDTEKNWTGFGNSALVTPVDAATVSASTFWSAKDADEILADINAGLELVWSQSAYVEMPDTVALPPLAWADIATRRLGVGEGTLTVLDYLSRNNLATAKTGQRLNIIAVPELDSMSADGGGRMVIYRRSREVLRFHLPMPKTVSTPYRSSIYGYQQAIAARTGGTEIRLPKAIAYVDEITDVPA